MEGMKAHLLAALLTLATSLPVQAQMAGTYEVVINKKQEEKKQSRWTLADWFAWKERVRVMDLWLAKNSYSSPYEFAIETGAANYERYSASTPASRQTGSVYSGKLSAYAGIAGLRAGYESTQEKDTEWSGSFNLRLFGRAIQDTHLNLEYGLRGVGLDRGSLEKETVQNQFGAVSMAIYFTKHFGIEGTYRKYLPANTSLDRSLEGERSQAGLFIDFAALRIFGEWRKDFREFTSLGIKSGEFREGFGGGLKLFF
jgi:hypothetical protein